MDMDMAKERIEEIRRTKFSIGGEPNPLTEDLNQAVKNLSAELLPKMSTFSWNSFRSPVGSALYDREWKTACQISDIPLVDTDYYGQEILSFKEELTWCPYWLQWKLQAVADNLKLPSRLISLTAEAVFFILECAHHLGSHKIIEALRSAKCFKTNAGCKCPGECFLVDPQWGCILMIFEGFPLIDQDFYGSCILSYRNELKQLPKGFGSQMEVRMESGVMCPGECVLRDKDGLFSSQLQVLEKHYEQQLLLFFSSAFHVKHSPSVDDYCELWKVWEGSGNQLSHADCCKFWAYVLKHWNAKTERTLADSLVKLPVGSDSDGILLSDKQDVFIADDLQLKDLFQRSSPQPIFVWYPERNLPSLPRTKLLEIYRKIGVRTISESVEREEASVVDVAELNQVNLKEILIKKGLVRLILGFLADPVMKMEAERRHEAVRGLLDMTILATNEPLHINYSLSLTSREIVR
ncbi:hypothetical protein CJ030_MR6G023565 [Morella rubra]|uniref:Uncharacterized protein n=1 Tax=Morella rubra TaxID=262757 RepID=A0A6A1VCW4_9ROSI|nr:hypothetical protein CJ030_MR6G023565 [Morella rubra]